MNGTRTWPGCRFAIEVCLKPGAYLSVLSVSVTAKEPQDMEIFFQQIINGLVLGSMYALVALGYTMVYGVLNLINFAHGDVLMIGAMIGITILNVVQHVAPGLPGVLKLLIAIAGAIPVCIAVNVIIERVAYRKLRDAPRLAPLITAIGVSILLQTLALMIWGRSPLPFPQLLAT